MASPNCRNFLKFLDFKKKYIQVITNSQFGKVDLTKKKKGEGGVRTEKNRIYPTEKRKKKKTLLVKIRSWPAEKNFSWYNMMKVWLRPTVKLYISHRKKKKKTLLVKIRSWPAEKNLSWYNMVNHITQFINRCYWPLQPSYYRLLKPCIFFETTLIQTVIQSPTPRKKKKPPMRPVWVNDWNDQKTSPNKKRIKQW